MTNAVSAATAIAALAAAAAAAAAASNPASSYNNNNNNNNKSISHTISSSSSSISSTNGSHRNHSVLLLAADHLPLQVTTTKVDLEFEIDIQLLTNGYDGTTVSYWIFGAEFCDTWVAFDVMCSTASILNLCAISMDRYIHIKDPLRYGRWVTRRVAVITIAAIWLLAAFVSFVPISLGIHRPDQPLIFEDNGKKYPTCALDLTPTYAVVSSCISFYFPCVVMIGIYCRLYCYAQKHVKSIKAVTRPGEVAEKQRYKSIRRPKNQPKKFKVRNLHHSSPYHVSDHKAAVTVGVIMGVFLICWVPFFCVNIMAAFCKTCIGGQTFKILTWLGYSNSAFNPIIYSIFNKEFRDAFKRILTMRNPWCCAQDVGNIHPRNSDRFITDYAAKNVVVMNSGRSSAELEQVSAI
ncbi:GH19686 [Drosophila grimshawi]|uniref:GH19686 n=1 Tax=Drosophila grimshawi TaxID=7222 RepID=B4K025_DROGR|nr:GH19686 [Drosophila grimshawi]